MNKIICSLIGSLFLLFIIWLVVAYAQYGSDLIYYRLDFVKSFNKLNVRSDWAEALSRFVTSGDNLRLRLAQAEVYFWEFIQDKLTANPNWWGLVLNVLIGGFSYLSKGIYYIYAFIYYFVDIVRAVAVWFSYSTWILIQLVSFIFKPEFVRV